MGEAEEWRGTEGEGEGGRRGRVGDKERKKETA
jgi:hypothetical protein